MRTTFKILLAAVILLITQNTNAQFRKKDNPRVPDRFHFGPRAGITINHYFGSPGYGSKALLYPSGGFAFDAQVAPIPLFVGMGINYVNYGFKHGSSTMESNAIQVPMICSYHINMASNLFINPFFGGFVAYAEKTNDHENLNGGLRLGCGMNYGRFTFDVNYDIGLVDVGKQRRRTTGTAFITLGFNCAGSR